MSQQDVVNSFDEDRLLGRLAELKRRVSDLEQDLDRSHRLAMLGMIAGTIAHEFNNLLTPILSYSQLALSSPDDRELVMKALQKAADTAEKASQIASSLLGFIREEPGVDEAGVKEVVRDTLMCLARTPEKDGIRVELEVAEDCRVKMKPVFLQQVLLNLVINACQAMKPGGGTIRVVARRSTWNAGRSGRGSGVEIEVSDTGSGIAPEHLDQVFEPFFTTRTDDAETPGTGLGLSICRRLVEAAGGSIRVASRVNEGSTFTICLPGVGAGTTQRAA